MDSIIAEILTIKHRFVTHDGLNRADRATAGAPGVITIGGTGSISFGRNAQGRMGRVGGWGFVFGDEGGVSISSGRRCGPRCAWKRVGAKTALRDRCLKPARRATPMNCCISSTRPNFRVTRWHRSRR